jgi:hypothetical protein
MDMAPKVLKNFKTPLAFSKLSEQSCEIGPQSNGDVTLYPPKNAKWINNPLIRLGYAPLKSSSYTYLEYCFK